MASANEFCVLKMLLLKNTRSVLSLIVHQIVKQRILSVSYMRLQKIQVFI